MIGRGSCAALLALVLIVFPGCATSVQPSASVSDAVTVYLTDYGRHSSLLLPVGDGVFNEYAFGDWDWFALNRTAPGDAVRALLFSRASTLGRRQLMLTHGDCGSSVARRIGAVRAMGLLAPRRRVDALVQRLDTLFERYRNTMTFNIDSDMWFVRYDGGYWGCYNCNHVTRSWLEALGCEVKGSAITSDFVLKPPDYAGRAAHHSSGNAR